MSEINENNENVQNDTSKVSIADIITESFGRDEQGASKCAVAVNHQVSDENEDVKVVKELSITSAAVNVIRNGAYLIVDLTFDRDVNEMRILWNYLTSFGQQQNAHADSTTVDILFFTFMPVSYMGQYFYSMFNPIFWAQQPSVTGGAINVIRILFAKESFDAYEGEPVDEKAIDKEIEEEEAEAQRIREIEEMKEAEHQRYLEDLDKQFQVRGQQ